MVAGNDNKILGGLLDGRW